MDFFLFLKNYDIFILLETWVEEGKEKGFEFLFGDYVLLWDFAVREHKYGRAKRGLLLGFKYKLQNFVKYNMGIEGRHVIEYSFGSQLCYLVPIYFSGSSEVDWESDYNQLWNLLIDERMSKNIMLVGDWNARVGEGQDIPEDVGIVSVDDFSCKRNSKDKVINVKGKKVIELCENFNFVIANGRVRGDQEGHFTFVGDRGRSVIDLCCVSIENFHHIKQLNVKAEPYSDHMPLELILRSPTVDEDSVLPLLPKLTWGKRDNVGYALKLANKCKGINVLPADSNLALTALNDLIYNSASNRIVYTMQNQKSGRQAWHDRECKQVRKRMFALLRLVRNSNDNETVRRDYCTCRREYKQLCRSKKLSYMLDLKEKLRNVKESKAFWEISRQFSRREFAVSGDIRAGDWINYFSMQFARNGNYKMMYCIPPFMYDECLDGPIQMTELSTALNKLRANKAPGEDRIPGEFYKFAPLEYRELLLQFFNHILENEAVPSSFTYSIIFPLHKKGDRGDVNNYRGISFMNSIGKIFVAILLRRLNQWVEDRKIIGENQAGFRSGYSNVDNIFVLDSIIRYNFSRGKKTYCFFIDFKAAFDGVDRESLFFRLHELGVSKKFISIIRGLYKDTRSSVWLKGGVTDDFETSRGLKQGCLLSPLLFLLFIYDICDYLGDGVLVGDMVINALLYADDLVIMAENKVALQRMINNLKLYCERWNLTLNMLKSKIVVFRKGGRLARTASWYYGSERIETVRSYKYLGVTFTTALSMVEHFKNRVVAAKYGINNTWRKLIADEGIPLSIKWEVFRAVSRSVVSYGAQVWGYMQSEEVEGFLRFFVKKLFCLPRNTPNYILYMETGVDLMWLYTLKVHLNYINKVFLLTENRFPRILAHLFVSRSVGWYKEWVKLGCKHGVDGLINRDEMKVCTEKFDILLSRIREDMTNKWLDQAARGQFHKLYMRLNLDHKITESYINDKNTKSNMSIIFKVRGSLLFLNYGPHRQEGRYECSLCNDHVNEDTLHFLGQCSVLKELRVRWLRKEYLEEIEVVNYLNGSNWESLIRYTREALKYRKLLIDEFNN